MVRVYYPVCRVCSSGSLFDGKNYSLNDLALLEMKYCCEGIYCQESGEESKVSFLPERWQNVPSLLATIDNFL